jgi:hypothetical protein
MIFDIPPDHHLSESGSELKSLALHCYGGGLLEWTVVLENDILKGLAWMHLPGRIICLIATQSVQHMRLLIYRQLSHLLIQKCAASALFRFLRRFLCTNFEDIFSIEMLGGGLEPPRYCYQGILSPQCLPFHHPSKERYFNQISRFLSRTIPQRLDLLPKTSDSPLDLDSLLHKKKDLPMIPYLEGNLPSQDPPFYNGSSYL